MAGTFEQARQSGGSGGVIWSVSGYGFIDSCTAAGAADDGEEEGTRAGAAAGIEAGDGSDGWSRRIWSTTTKCSQFPWCRK